MSLLEKIQNTYWSIVPHQWRPGWVWYRFKCWVWHRHSTVKPRYLSHTWVDRTELMPHMMFEILSDFIEGECGPDGHVEWYGEHPHLIDVDGKQVNVRDEMQDLYDWWHNDYQKNIDHILDEWSAHRELHVKDVFTPYKYGEDDDDEDDGDEGEGACLQLCDDESDLLTLDHEYSSEEARLEDERLFDVVQERQEFYRVGLERRLHRIIPLIPFMWT